MSTQTTKHHEQAAEQYGHAARAYQEAVAHYRMGHDAQTAHHVLAARGHHTQATAYASAAATSHAAAYGKPEDVWAEAQVRERVGGR